MITMDNLFITVEGIDGAGKSTATTIIKNFLENKGLKTITTAEPNGKIRELLLNSKTMDNKTELLLMEASRCENVEKIIKPALKNGYCVICDRYIDSTIAYQGYGRGLDLNTITYMNNYAIDNIIPDLTIILDLPENIGLKRQTNIDRISSEGIEFMKRVRYGFIEIYNKEKRCKLINSSNNIETMKIDIQTIIGEAIEQRTISRITER